MEANTAALTASLRAGAVTLTFEVDGYAFAAERGADADWLHARLVVTSNELVVRRQFLTLAPLSVCVSALAEFVGGRVDRVIMANTEEDVEVAIERHGGDLCGRLRVSLQAGLSGVVEGTFPLTLDAVEALHRELEEASWVFPRRT